MSNLTDFLSLSGGGATRTTGEVVYFLMNEKVIENPQNSTYIPNGDEYLLDGTAYLKSSYPGLYQIVGNAGCNSVDKQFVASTGTNIYSILYNNGLYLALDSNGALYSSTILTSLDDWRFLLDIGSTNTLAGKVNYTNGRYFALGTNESFKTSTDGIVWVNNTGLTSVDDLNEVAYGHGLYVMTCRGAGVATSTNGINWSRITISGFEINSVVYGNGIFVIVGGPGAASEGRYSTSTNGTTWSSFGSAGGNDFISVTYAQGLFVTVALSGGGIFTSTDAVTWTDTSPTITEVYTDVVYGNGKFYAIGSTTGRRTSTDGYTWTTATSSSVNIRDVYYSNGVFLYCGQNGIIGTTTDFNTKMYSSTNAFDGETQFYLPRISKSNYNILQETSTLTNAVFRSFYKVI